MTSRTPIPVPESDAPKDLWDRTDDRSVINLVPGAVQSAMIDAAKKDPALFSLDEHQLLRRLKDEERGPNPTDNRLRLAFWMEYDRAQAEHRVLSMATVFAGVCTKGYFYGTYLADHRRVAWLLCPPVQYTTKLLEALDYGTDRMRDILAMDIKNPNGSVNVKLAELQAKIWFMIDQRLKGSYTQRIEQKSMSLNISTTDKAAGAAVVENSMEALDRRIKELDRRERAALNLGNERGVPVEATVVEAETAHDAHGG